jgi:light-regulated signal transduction histidine kinase (bacteriophytochrome)
MKMQIGLEIFLAGRKYYINSEREQILDLLVSSYEEALHLNEALKRSEWEVRALNVDLEQRAAELEVANNELEAFSHSVSHDLRAPLRQINGYVSILEEDCADRLDGDARRYLQQLRASTTRMSELIDDMLHLSRVTRAELMLESTDLSTIAGEVVNDLRRSQPERMIEVHVQPGIRAQCDSRLIRIALENLLGNAWKFTGKRPDPCIEFGVIDRAGTPTYFVRDNGAGFDMAYADSLFSPFRRLHTEEEFPGTGIGLATVQRIVHRHGGRLSVQAEVGKGAEFFFTL